MNTPTFREKYEAASLDDLTLFLLPCLLIVVTVFVTIVVGGGMMYQLRRAQSPVAAVQRCP